jgi:hypothetical protein
MNFRFAYNHIRGLRFNYERGLIYLLRLMRLSVAMCLIVSQGDYIFDNSPQVQIKQYKNEQIVP